MKLGSVTTLQDLQKKVMRGRASLKKDVLVNTQSLEYMAGGPQHNIRVVEPRQRTNAVEHAGQ